jgi:hypothetical protein
MHSSWWSVGGALVVVLSSVSSACSNRPGELVRETEPAPTATARVPDSLARQADATTLKTALKDRLSRSGRGLKVERTAAGTSRIALDGRFRSVHVATRGADGKKHIDCVTSNGQLDDLLKRDVSKQGAPR